MIPALKPTQTTETSDVTGWCAERSADVATSLTVRFDDNGQFPSLYIAAVPLPEAVLMRPRQSFTVVVNHSCVYSLHTAYNTQAGTVCGQRTLHAGISHFLQNEHRLFFSCRFLCN